jgi:PAS domain S-box-containing protein
VTHKPSYEELERRVQELEQEMLIRTRADEALRDSEKRYRCLVETSSDWLWEVDAKGRYVYASPSVREILGYAPEEVVGRTPFDLMSKEEAQRVGAIFAEIAAGRRPFALLENVNLHRDGRRVVLETSGVPVFGPDGEFMGYRGMDRDITERKRVEEALRHSEEEKSAILNSFKTIFIEYLDPEMRIIWANGTRGRAIGQPPENLRGKHCYEAIRGLDKPCEGCTAVRTLETGKIEEGEFNMPDGRTLLFCSSPVMHDQAIKGVVHVAIDITERKQAEEALKRSNILLFTQKETSIDGILAVDENDTIVSTNQRFVDMWGLSHELVERKDDVPVLQAVVEKVREPQTFLQRVGYLYAHRNETSLERITLKDGRIFERYSAPMNGSDGKYYGRVWYFRDITERKLMEKAVAEAEEKYRDIFENSVTGIYQVSLEGHFLSLNAAIANMLGYDSTEELLNTVTDVRQLYVHPERRSNLLRLIEEHGSVREFEAEFFRKDKSVIWVSHNVRAVHSSTGEIAYLEGTATDITDGKLLRAQLDQAQKMEAIGTLAGGIAHDFNNILSPIIGYTELSLNSVPENSRLSHDLKQVLLSASRAKDLVRQILTFSRKTNQEQKPVQVSLLIKEALKLLRSSLPSTIEIRQAVDVDTIDSTTLADPTKIHQVLMNLCTNAAHAMRAQGGTLTVTLKNVEVGKGAARGTPHVEPGPYLRLSVADTGCGMEEAVKQRIFDPYFTTKGPDEGTGLGLAVVYGIVKDLSGAIAISSKPTEGTTFDVYFPRVKKIQAPASERSKPLPTGHGRVLVVDDEKSIVDMVKEMLETLGYEAVPRYSGADALEAFRGRPESYDLVITDMTMPHMTGIGLAKEILTIRRQIPIILCTGFSDTVNENKIKLLGIKQLLMKPVSMRDLAVAVNKLLDRDRKRA